MQAELSAEIDSDTDKIDISFYNTQFSVNTQNKKL